MEIKKGKNRFYIGHEFDPTAEMTFVPTGETKIIIDHTYVSEQFEGQGIGKQLLNAVVEYARENNLKILATCPFALKHLTDNPEYADVYIG